MTFNTNNNVYRVPDDEIWLAKPGNDASAFYTSFLRELLSFWTNLTD